VGIHPWYADQEKSGRVWQVCICSASDKRLTAIVECGMDKNISVTFACAEKYFLNVQISFPKF
jgi:Tat protein secretion system quality control protein TatD with DNase activity